MQSVADNMRDWMCFVAVVEDVCPWLTVVALIRDESRIGQSM